MLTIAQEHPKEYTSCVCTDYKREPIFNLHSLPNSPIYYLLENSYILGFQK